MTNGTIEFNRLYHYSEAFSTVFDFDAAWMRNLATYHQRGWQRGAAADGCRGWGGAGVKAVKKQIRMKL